jgi:tetratricopeptide (TPR) repeat protein
VLDAGRERLRPWDRITIDMIRARCRGDMAEDLRLTGQRYRAYPGSLLAQATYGSTLQNTDQPRAALEVLLGFTPLPQWEPWYWSNIAGCRHALGEYRAELAITDRWRDSAAVEWRFTRGRALAALGREREVMALYRSTTGVAVDSVAEQQLEIASELAAHGYTGIAKAMAESLLARLQVGRGVASSRAPSIAWANRLLGRPEAEREALERVALGTADTVELLETRARVAVLRADTAEAARVDSALAEQSDRPLRAPWARGRLLLARARLAAGFGRREDAVARLHEATARGHISDGGTLAFHRDLLLLPLRGYPPFDALLRPAN